MILRRSATRAEKRFRSLTRLLIEKLREAIVSGKLRPGEPLAETQMAATLKVGPAALRDALRTLESEGYVTFRTDNAVVVSKPTREEIEDFFAIAGALEGLAARLAVERARPGEIERLRELHQTLKEACQRRDVVRYFDANNDFHRLIADIARNERLYRLIDQLRQELQKTRTLSLRMPLRLDYSMREHDQILDAFLKKNPELASAAMIRHLNSQMEILIRAGEPAKEPTQ
jgi:DNA-binding GntR family transcriptional regulator